MESVSLWLMMMLTTSQVHLHRYLSWHVLDSICYESDDAAAGCGCAPRTEISRMRTAFSSLNCSSSSANKRVENADVTFDSTEQ